MSKTTAAVRARAASTSAATRREVEQSIARFEKRLDDANDALKTLGGHLGRGATGSYKDVTAALTALRREASKTNKQALKDFDSLRAALTKKTSAARTNTRKKTSSTAKKTSSTAKKASSTAKRSTAKRSTAKRSTAKRSTGSRSTGSRARKSS